MEQSPSSDADSSSASQEVRHSLCNAEAHYGSQELATCPHPEPDQSSPLLPLHIPILMLSHLFLGLPRDLLLAGFLATPFEIPVS